MKNRLISLLAVAILALSYAAKAQTSPIAPAFEVASIHRSQPPDMQKMIAALQAGQKPESVHIDGSRAIFRYMSLKRLVAYAYSAQPYEISGPDWLATDRFDIVATIPAGAGKDSVPGMMRTLLRDRFHLEVRRATLDDQPVLALVPGKDGANLKAVTAALEPLDLTQPLKSGQSIVEAPDGAILLTANPDGSSTYDMGERGDFRLKYDRDTLSMHLTSDAITMSGLAVMINVLGSGQGRQVVDRTQLTGVYPVAIDFSLMDLLGSLHDDGIDLPVGGPGPGGPGPGSSSGPGGGAGDTAGNATLAGSLSRLGLRLEKTRASVTRFVIDHIDAAPTEN